MNHGFKYPAKAETSEEWALISGTRHLASSSTDDADKLSYNLEDLLVSCVFCPDHIISCLFSSLSVCPELAGLSYLPVPTPIEPGCERGPRFLSFWRSRSAGQPTCHGFFLFLFFVFFCPVMRVSTVYQLDTKLPDGFLPCRARLNLP